MKLPQLLLQMASMFERMAEHQSQRPNYNYTITNRNPHNFTRYEVAPNFFIHAFNEDSAKAQYEKMQAKKAMRLTKSAAKELNSQYNPA